MNGFSQIWLFGPPSSIWRIGIGIFPIVSIVTNGIRVDVLRGDIGGGAFLPPGSSLFKFPFIVPSMSGPDTLLCGHGLILGLFVMGIFFLLLIVLPSVSLGLGGGGGQGGSLYTGKASGFTVLSGISSPYNSAIR